MNITPSQITALKPNEIFVFGSNLQGDHAGGAAKFAVIKFGAEMGNGDGIQGNSYAIPTLSEPAYDPNQLDKLKLPINVINQYVKKFISFAKQHQDLFFYVTPIGCGIAGFTEDEIAPLFGECINLPNVALPQSFFNILGINENRKMTQIFKLTESNLNRLVERSARRVLREMNGQYADGYSSLQDKINELDEINGTLVGDDDINDLIQQMRQIINSKVGVKTNLGFGND